MMRTLLACLLLIGCTTQPGAGGPMADAPIGNPGPFPTWQLQDVNPQSAGNGQTYGLDTFNGRIIVVTLLAGF